MPGKAKRVTYKQYAGFLIKGAEPVPIDDSTDLHMQRAVYLAMQLESPKMGTVQSYDRCAMSGGPFHFTAIQPRTMKQGSLFKLLQKLYTGPACFSLDELLDAFQEENWYLARNGTLRDITTNKLISARTIRDTFTPIGGKVPLRGVRYNTAKAWALLFHHVLEDPVTYAGQMEFAIDYLIKGQQKLENGAYCLSDSSELNFLRVEGYKVCGIKEHSISLEDDFAMCFYHSHSVNAPGIARKCLQWALKQPTDQFARALIWKLGRTKYGRWQDQKGSGKNRYDHTRSKARTTGFWPKEFFTELAPKDLSTRFK